MRFGSRRSRFRREAEGTERLPAFGLVVLVEAGSGAVHDDDVGLAVAGQVHELRAAAQRDIGLEGDGFERGELCLHLLPAAGSVSGIGLRLRL